MLKPCPFCGCEAVLFNEFFDDYLVMCSNSGCAAEGPLKATSDEAETAWNARPDGVVEIPTWDECRDKIEHGEDLNPIEQFVYDNEPSGEQEESFREGLKKAIAAAGGE